MTNGYTVLFETIQRELVAYSSDPEEIYLVAPLVLVDLWMGLWRDAPTNDHRRHMAAQLAQYLIDERTRGAPHADQNQLHTR